MQIKMKYNFFGFGNWPRLERAYSQCQQNLGETEFLLSYSASLVEINLILPIRKTLSVTAVRPRS